MPRRMPAISKVIRSSHSVNPCCRLVFMAADYTESRRPP
jgi:hypothetical protein